MSGDRVEKLPFVLLGLRSYMIPEFDIAAAEVIYGETIRLPADLIGDKAPKVTMVPMYRISFNGESRCHREGSLCHTAVLPYYIFSLFSRTKLSHLSIL